MPTSRYALFFVMVTFLMGGLSACEGGGGDVAETEEGSLVLGRTEAARTIERGVVPGRRALVLRDVRGRVRLQGTDSADVARLRFVQRARGDDQDEAREALSDLEVVEEGDAQAFVYRVEAGATERTTLQVEGTVPRTAPLRIEMASGPVDLSRVAGPVRVQTGNGAVRVAGTTQDVRVETRNGRILLGMQALPEGAEVQLTTSNGDVEVVVPSLVAADVEATTEAGEIRVEGLTFTERSLEPAETGARFEGRLREGGARIRVQTQNGTVLLRGGAMRALPDPEEDAAEDPSRLALPDDSSETPAPQDTTAAAPTGDFV